MLTTLAYIVYKRTIYWCVLRVELETMISVVCTKIKVIDLGSLHTSSSLHNLRNRWVLGTPRTHLTLFCREEKENSYVLFIFKHCRPCRCSYVLVSLIFWESYEMGKVLSQYRVLFIIPKRCGIVEGFQVFEVKSSFWFCHLLPFFKHFKVSSVRHTIWFLLIAIGR